MGQGTGSSDEATHYEGATPTPARSDGAWSPGARIGPYRIIEEVGEGGMGRVYLAEQISPVRRRVALKTLRSQDADPLLEAMFAVEAQALAQLDHPAIARIYEVGRSERGETFLALEWVDGQALDHYLASHTPPLAQRVELLRKVCLGAHHAHQRGVIHRDIKPANILVGMVDGHPEPRLIDFGIAVAHARNTAAQVVGAGSRGYMAPEQAQTAQVPDVRADVYSLGMTLLASLLADRSPDAVASTRMRTLREFLGRSTSRLAIPGVRPELALLARLPAELRAILRRTLAERPEDRYPSAQALAEDLESFLARRPVSAMGSSRWYMSRKFVSRHRLWIGASALALLALCAGLGMAVHGMLVAREGQQAAEAAAVEAARQGRRSALLAEFLRDVLGGITPEEARGQDTTLLRRIFDRATRRASIELAAEPELLLEFDAMMGANLRLLGEPAQAAERLQQVLDAMPETMREGAVALRAWRQLAQSRFQLGEDPAAIAAARQALEIARSSHGSAHPETVLSLSELAWVMQATDLAEALELVGQAQEQGAVLFAADDPAQVEIVLRRASLQTMAGQLDAARASFDHGLPLLEARWGSDHPKVLAAKAERGIVLLREKRFADAEAALRPLLEPIAALYGEDHGSTLALRNNLAGALRQQGKVDEAAPLYEGNFASWVRLHGRAHPNALLAAINLATLRIDQKRAAEGLDLHAETLRLAPQAFAENHRIWVRLHLAQARLLAALARHREALAEYETAYARSRTQLGVTALDSLEIARDALRSAEALGDAAAAQAWRQRAAEAPAEGP